MVLKDDKWHKKAKRATERRKGKKFEKVEKPGQQPQCDKESDSSDENEQQHARRKVVSNAWRYEASASSASGSEQEEAPPEPDYARMKGKEFVLKKSKYDTDSSDEEVIAKRGGRRKQYIEAEEFEALQRRIDKKNKLDSLKQSFAASTSAKVEKQHSSTLNADDLENFLDQLL